MAKREQNIVQKTALGKGCHVFFLEDIGEIIQKSRKTKLGENSKKQRQSLLVFGYTTIGYGPLPMLANIGSTIPKQSMYGIPTFTIRINHSCR